MTGEGRWKVRQDLEVIMSDTDFSPKCFSDKASPPYTNDYSGDLFYDVLNHIKAVMPGLDSLQILPVRVSTRITSPIFINRGTCTIAPVSRVGSAAYSITA